MVSDLNSAQVVGTRSRQSIAIGTRSRQVRFGTRSEWKVRLVPDLDSRNLTHKYRMAEMVQKRWNHLEVKVYTWKIKTLVHETFSLLAQ
jgi:hypothetical protein